MRLYLFASIAAGVLFSLLGVGPLWSVALAVLAPAVLLAVPRFLLGALSGATTPDTGGQQWTSATSGAQFEDHVAHLVRSAGLPVIMTATTGDWGVDLIVGQRPNRVAVQCKWRSRPVGSSAVQEVVAGAPMHDCTKTVVVTNHEFTPAARKLAERHGCELVDGGELPRLRTTIKRLAASTQIG